LRSGLAVRRLAAALSSRYEMRGHGHASNMEIDLSSLIDAIADPLILLEGGRVMGANRAALALMREDPVGASASDVLPPQLLLALETHRPEAPVIVADFGGPRRHWEVRAGAISPGRSLLHLIDRTAAEAVEKMRVDFVANASHELRTPIAAISGFAETLADDEAGGDPATRHRFVEIIAREARRMQRLVEDLMSLSRIEADRYVAPGHAVDLAATAVAAARAAAEQRQPRGADLVLIPVTDSVTVRGDRAQLAQLVHNLVSNGFKYGAVGTPVRVSLGRHGGMARLIVEDQGEGISPKHLPRITERFFRVNASRSRAVGGTGLGLAIVKHIVERHGGVLAIDSEVGRGTTVRVDLPLAVAQYGTRVPAGAPGHQNVTGRADAAAQVPLAERKRSGASHD
jgi:two-component system phosphate regulon sensor histidine kinase PhoR